MALLEQVIYNICICSALPRYSFQYFAQLAFTTLPLLTSKLFAFSAANLSCNPIRNLQHNLALLLQGSAPSYPKLPEISLYLARTILRNV